MSKLSSSLSSRLSGQTLAADLSYIAQPASDFAEQSSSSPSYPRTLYPPIEPNKSGHLEVGDGHNVYWEESGQGAGAPAALFLHGGPGGGCSPRSRRFFDPTHYRIVCLDQRGCGRSTPNAADDWSASIYENNTSKLVSDLEKIRVFLGIARWSIVVGGSWGSTLALAYAETHPAAMSDILLRGVFLFSPDEVDYLFQNGGTSGQNPEAWEQYTRFIEDTSDNIAAERTNFLGAYFKRLKGTDEMRKAAASAFVGYELSISKAFVDLDVIKDTLQEPGRLIPFALFEVVYMLNNGFMRRGQILDECHHIVNAGHRVSIVHGRADYVCQPKAAHQLYKALRKAGHTQVALEFVAGAGHSDTEPGLTDAMVRETDRFRTPA
mmetsp:Transcript_8234/g.16490  ORF Transcript_8234/g.16490 Transcript_8234/m.16490 type:complete len:379 (-) Transcript_8234:83-1219(-)